MEPMTTAPPLLLLDVDGPLNPYAAKPHRRPLGYQTFRLSKQGTWLTGRDTRRHKGLRVWLHPEHGAWLTKLAAQTGLELAWATTWQHQANQHIGPSIGLPTLPVIEFPTADLHPIHGWTRDGKWKWDSVLNYAAERPLAWLDDEHSAPTPGRRAFDRSRADTPTLLHHINPAIGITPNDIDAIAAWAKHVTFNNEFNSLLEQSSLETPNARAIQAMTSGTFPNKINFSNPEKPA